MPNLFYSAVVGDPLDSGKESYVIGGKGESIPIDDESGRSRDMAFIGDSAYCGACGSVGVIVGGARVGDHHRFIDSTDDKRQQAVGGDQVQCKCPTRPHILAVYGRQWYIEDDGYLPLQSPAPSPVRDDIHDEQYVLTDLACRPLSNVRYRIVANNGQVFEGTTNASGETQRVATERTIGLKLYTSEA